MKGNSVYFKYWTSKMMYFDRRWFHIQKVSFTGKIFTQWFFKQSKIGGACPLKKTSKKVDHFWFQTTYRSHNSCKMFTARVIGRRVMFSDAAMIRATRATLKTPSYATSFQPGPYSGPVGLAAAFLECNYNHFYVYLPSCCVCRVCE